MTNRAFIADITIPGQSAADLTQRASHAVQASCAVLSNARSELRSRLRMERAVHDLDRHMLQDLGLDRSAC